MVNQKAVFLDRDGVIIKAPVKNRKPVSIRQSKHLKIYKGCQKLVRKFKLKKYKVFMITNQPEVARKKISKKFVIKINNFIKKKLNLDEVYVCYHDDHHNCNCRKPKPGMIISAAKNWKINIKESILVGDRKKDIEAGYSVGLKCYFIDRNYNEKKPSKKKCTYVNSITNIPFN